MAAGGNEAPCSDVGLQMVSDLGLASRGFECSTVARGQTAASGFTYSLHCSSIFWFNQFYIKDPKR